MFGRIQCSCQLVRLVVGELKGASFLLCLPLDRCGGFLFLVNWRFLDRRFNLFNGLVGVFVGLHQLIGRRVLLSILSDDKVAACLRCHIRVLLARVVGCRESSGADRLIVGV
jgi:hypothetical protein